MISSRAFPLVIAAPSGTGKTSLARALVERNSGIEFSVSATTRARRKYEQGSHDYHFVTEAEFDRLADTGALLEWATVHGRKYGTLRSEVESRLAAGSIVVLDIDVQGARQVQARMVEAVLVFILPPSAEELRRRLTNRGSEHSEERLLRLATARQELKAAREFDYIVVNDDFDRALAALEAIVTAERCRAARATEIEQAVKVLDAGLEEGRT